MHYDLEKINDKIVELKAELRKAESVRSRLREAEIKAHLLKEIKAHLLKEEDWAHSYEEKKNYISFGSWECKSSPIGICAYDTKEDPAEDDCLFCHEPDERK